MTHFRKVVEEARRTRLLEFRAELLDFIVKHEGDQVLNAFQDATTEEIFFHVLNLKACESKSSSNVVDGPWEPRRRPISPKF